MGKQKHRHKARLATLGECRKKELLLAGAPKQQEGTRRKLEAQLKLACKGIAYKKMVSAVSAHSSRPNGGYNFIGWVGSTIVVTIHTRPELSVAYASFQTFRKDRKADDALVACVCRLKELYGAEDVDD